MLGQSYNTSLVTLSCTLSMRGRSESSNGISPVTAMNSTTPRLHESDNIGLYGVPRNTSGATYAALPQYVELSTRRRVVCTIPYLSSLRGQVIGSPPIRAIMTFGRSRKFEQAHRISEELRPDFGRSLYAKLKQRYLPVSGGWLKLKCLMSEWMNECLFLCALKN